MISKGADPETKGADPESWTDEEQQRDQSSENTQQMQLQNLPYPI